MLEDIENIDEITNDHLDQLIVDITASEDKDTAYRLAFNRLFDLTRRYVDNNNNNRVNSN